MMSRNFRVGDLVVYTMNKRSAAPGPRASNVKASRTGELYSYQVDKYWIVANLLENTQVLLRTRRGKTHTVDANDVLLRRARWWERWFLRGRFPKLGDESGTEK